MCKKCSASALPKGRLCSACKNAYQCAWRKLHLKRSREYQKKYHKKHKNKINRLRRKNRASGKWISYTSKYYQRNKARILANHNRYLRKNRHKRRAYIRKLYWRNPERFRQYQREYGKRYPERVRRRARLWAKNNPDKVRIINHRRRAQIEKTGGTFTYTEWISLCKKHNWKCTYCEKRITKRTASPDHRIPVSKGGTSFIRNILPSCRSCNYRKYNRTEKEFRKILAKS